MRRFRPSIGPLSALVFAALFIAITAGATVMLSDDARRAAPYSVTASLGLPEPRLPPPPDIFPKARTPERAG